jgi:hypothetical protein
LGLVFLLLLAGLMSKAVLVAARSSCWRWNLWPLRRGRRAPGASLGRRGSRWCGEKPAVVSRCGGVRGAQSAHHVSGTAACGGALDDAPGIDRAELLRLSAKIAAPLRLNVIYPEHDVAAGRCPLRWRWRWRARCLLFPPAGRRRPHLVGGLWFLLLLAPVERGVRLGLAQCADRFSYLPLIGLDRAGVDGGGMGGAAPRRRG